MKYFDSFWKRLAWSVGIGLVLQEVFSIILGGKVNTGAIFFLASIAFFAVISLLQYFIVLYRFNKEVTKEDPKEDEIIDNDSSMND